jgi:hypothetical protein
MSNKKYAIDRNIRQCLSYVIKKDGPFRWSTIVGFSKEEFLEHIKKEFKDGMTFENYGEWVISFHIPKRCYNFSSIRDEDFKRFWSLKNITPRWLKEAQQQKKKINEEEVNKYSLWDILPVGNIASLLEK